MSRTISLAPVLKNIDVDAPPARAFKIFAGFRWWPRSHSILPSKSPQVAVAVEPKVGGRWFERGEDGSECDWGKVLVWEPPRRMVMTWLLDSTFQINPKVVTEVEVTFTAIGVDRTRVVLEHRLFDRHGEEGEKVRAAVDSPDGWAGLLTMFAEAAAA
ncbi:SRPBCC family protein [Enhydrobacter sp.]|jgi:uncharacterized protein YndB with AHSA1/START domain|uniref:SRPBCC family protein n=1 Tax=Enhydrobacter sp. TaxID=1894999 RepID=UPI0026071B14|nr:SRPBCC family protein [Enhydrobacter sp.]WIM14355.1 MAG: hypothetical protein OJF58_005325 [Enhydrobacter sp.]